MRYQTWLSRLILAVSACLIVNGGIAGPGLAQGPEPPAFVPGEILVKFQAGVAAQSGQYSLRAEGLQPLEVVGQSEVIRVRVEPGREQEVIAELLARGDVAIAEPNYLAHALEIWPNDIYSSYQWAPGVIGAPAAWGITTGGSNVTIAIIDTGIDLDHPDLSCAGKLLSGKNYINSNLPPNDDNGHGTHVAGIAAACSNNSIGVTGIAWNAQLLPFKVLDSTGWGTYANVAAAVEEAANRGAKIINLSLGGPESQVLAGAISYAVGKGALVVAAAGNSGDIGNAEMYPGSDPNVFAVAATDSYDNWGSFSSYHPYVDIAAPGVSIYSTYCCHLDYRGREIIYAWNNGTSMAAPHVAGLAALIWSSKPTMTATQVRSLIEVTADDLGDAGKDIYFGYGRINAGRALASISGVEIFTSSGPVVEKVGPVFMVDDGSGPFPAESLVTVRTPNENVTTWTAGEAPAADWLLINPTTVSSRVTAAGTSGQFALTVVRPSAGYGTHQTTLIITGTTSSGQVVGPITSTVMLNYVPELTRYTFPVIWR